MIKYRLHGLAEGVVGKSHVYADSFDDLLSRYPELAKIKGKLSQTGSDVSAVNPCDG
ncbi:hypothetical protein ACMV5L_03000 [Serratia plymuthica]|uniref:hypothetical protein n=1 Tax=Serratia plymuthica TaxID=82996 RepID=UPI003DA24940